MITTSVIRDQNGKPIWWGVSSVDGVSLVPIQVDGLGFVLVEDGTSTMAVMSTVPITFPRDANRIPCIGGVSSADPALILPISVNPATGAIQVQST
jgi:hypothetical protein